MYLKENVAPEPLVGGWYAWSHLISPATCAMNVAERHLKIMSSYIQAPQIHAAAAKDPRMAGGPFMRYSENRVAEIRRLRETTLREQAQMIIFAEAVKNLSSLLRKEAAAYSLDGLYPKIPEPLRGYVELFYDIHQQPSFRFYEWLLYQSEYYDCRQQSIAFQIVQSDDRAFVLSTPRLGGDSVLQLDIPFDSEVLDRLFSMRQKEGSYASIRDALGVTESQDRLFRSFFTDASPRQRPKFVGDGVRMRYVGHGCVLLETSSVAILTDPVVSYRYDSELPRYTFTDLPEFIDYVLITHNHQDHVILETLLQLRHRIRNVIVPKNGTGQLQDPSLKLLFRALRFQNVIEIDEFDRIDVPGGAITGVPFMGEHADLNIRTKMCHHVRLGSHSVLFAADSSVHEPKLYEYVHREIGDVTALFLGMECDGAPLSWLYGPLLAEPIGREQDRSRRLAGSDFEKALRMVEMFRPSEVYVYAMGQEPWLNYIMSLKYSGDSNPIVHSNRLINACKDRGIVAERLYGAKEIVYS